MLSKVDTSTGHDAGEGVVSGVFPNRSHENYPDIEQEKRRQARQAHAFAVGEADELPSFASKGPDAQLADGDLDTSKFSAHEKPSDEDVAKAEEKPEPKKTSARRSAAKKTPRKAADKS